MTPYLKWMLLTPREASRFDLPADSRHAVDQLYNRIRASLDKVTGELELSQADIEAVRVYARNWRACGGHEKAFQAVVEAIHRHNL